MMYSIMEVQHFFIFLLTLHGLFYHPLFLAHCILSVQIYRWKDIDIALVVARKNSAWKLLPTGDFFFFPQSFTCNWERLVLGFVASSGGWAEECGNCRLFHKWGRKWPIGQLGGYIVRRCAPSANICRVSQCSLCVTFMFSMLLQMFLLHFEWFWVRCSKESVGMSSWNLWAYS